MNQIVVYYMGVPIEINEDGCYLIENGEHTLQFATEEEAKEYIDEELGL